MWKSTARYAWVQTLALIFVFVATFIIAALQGRDEAAGWVGVTMVVVLFVLTASGSWVTSRSARAIADVTRTHGGARWTFDQQGIVVEGALSRTTLKWEIVSKVVEERDRLAFALTPSVNPVFPLRVLTKDQAEALRALIAEVTASGRLGRGVD